MKKRNWITIMKCDCCGEISISGAVHRHSKKVTCDKCLKFAPSHYGFMPAEVLHKYIKQKQSKKWWEFWK